MTTSGAGEGPVTIVSGSTAVTSGTAVQEKLITAARVFADILRPTYGPRGLDKMLYKSNGETAVTNDGAKIVAELMVKHPAAKMFVSMGEAHENAIGDGVTGALLLCGEMLIEAGRLLEKGLHPLTTIAGYRMAADIAIDTVESLADPLAVDDIERVARTALTGKSAEGEAALLSHLVVEALRAVMRQEDGELRCEAEDVAMHKLGKGALSDSHVTHGVVMRRRILLDALPRRIDDAVVAVLNCNIAPREQIRTAEVEIENVDQLDAFIASEEARRDALAQALLASGANVFLTSGEVDKGVLHRLMRAGCFAAGELGDHEIRNVAACTGARVVELAMDLGPEDVGQAGALDCERNAPTDQVEDIIRLIDCPNPKVVTIEVGGANDLATEEIIRALHDALRVTSLAMRGGEVLVGGGAALMSASLAVRHAAEKEAGRERLAMEAFGRALEVIPATLADNAGVDALDRILELRAAHRNGDITAGIRADGSVGPTDALEPLASLALALDAACETCSGMLRIDQVVSARGD